MEYCIIRMDYKGSSHRLFFVPSSMMINGVEHDNYLASVVGETKDKGDRKSFYLIGKVDFSKSTDGISSILL